DFDVFHPDRMASRILGMGDMLTLIEQAEEHFEEEEAERMASKLVSGKDFTLEDFLEQMTALRRMGPLQDLLGMLPGMGPMRAALNSNDEKDLVGTAAILRSMPRAERQPPKIINGSRRVRIARGSGMTVSDVNGLVERFFEARKMMQQMAGMAGFPGARRRTPTKAKGKKGKKGKQVRRGPTPPRLPPGGLPGGLPGRPPGGTPLAELPPGVELPDLSKLKFPKQP